MTTSWDHGYYSNEAYTSGYYRETAPNWLDFAALIRGHRPPRKGEGEPFRYLDLGCGMGFGLCLLASLYPEGTFLGIDFQPDHIAHAQGLAADLSLRNVQFLEGDFVVLARDPSLLGVMPDGCGAFDYCIAHGIATWIVPDVQDALLSLASASLRAGGIFYCSYNTFPGWLPLTAFHQLVRFERSRTDASTAMAFIQRAITVLNDALGTEEQPTPLARNLPGLRLTLSDLARQDQRYLIQEYANTGWQPLYVEEFWGRCQNHKLRPLATATLPELFPQLLPPSIQEFLRQEGNPDHREALTDLATFRSFRRDLFAKGLIRLSSETQQKRLAMLRVRLQEPRLQDDWRFTTSFGELTGDRDIYDSAVKALLEGPLTLEQWSERIAQSPDETIIITCLLLHDNRIGLDRGEAGESALPSCQHINHLLRQEILLGAPYAVLSAPRIGTGVGFTFLEAMLAAGLEEGLDGDMLALCIRTGIAAQGRNILDNDRNPISDPLRQNEILLEAAEKLRSQRLPALQSLGAVAPTNRSSV